MDIPSLFMRRQRHIQRLVEHYLDHWQGCMRTFRDAWDVYFTSGLGEDFFYRVDATHKEESKADDMRRKIELELYSKALLPESRGDILRIIEAMDYLLTDAERSLFETQLQELTLPERIVPAFTNLVDLSCKCCEVLSRVARAVLVDDSPAREVIRLVAKVGDIESEADHLERSLIRGIFKLDLVAGEKVLLKDLVAQVASISDGAERVGDLLTLVSVKRRV